MKNLAILEIEMCIQNEIMVSQIIMTQRLINIKMGIRF